MQQTLLRFSEASKPLVGVVPFIFDAHLEGKNSAYRLRIQLSGLKAGDLLEKVKKLFGRSIFENIT